MKLLKKSLNIFARSQATKQSLGTNSGVLFPNVFIGNPRVGAPAHLLRFFLSCYPDRVLNLSGCNNQAAHSNAQTATGLFAIIVCTVMIMKLLKVFAMALTMTVMAVLMRAAVVLQFTVRQARHSLRGGVMTSQI